jgi:hypothetical protein
MVLLDVTDVREKDIESLNEIGYDWVRGRFGPPPGIPRSLKNKLDAASDDKFLSFVIRMGQEERQSLLVAEEQRLRTFKTGWRCDFIDEKVLAREGFYYTGVSDRVQCVFCSGYLGNWEIGDCPKSLHKKYFSYCKIPSKRITNNIPLAKDGEKDLLANPVLTVEKLVGKSSLLPDFITVSARIESYAYYARSNPVSPADLSEAGFVFQGSRDRVKCFHCGGELELWDYGDCPLLEHAKWFPGCAFIREKKGEKFIIKARAGMKRQEIALSQEICYRSDGVEFLTNPRPDNYENYDAYQVCRRLGFDELDLQSTFQRCGFEEGVDVQTVLSELLRLQASDLQTKCTRLNQNNKKRGFSSPGRDGPGVNATVKETVEENMMKRLEINTPASNRRHKRPTLAYIDTGSMKRSIDCNEVLKLDEIPFQTLLELESTRYCQICCREINCINLNCGHLTFCNECGVKSPNCPVCKRAIRGVCKIFLS